MYKKIYVPLDNSEYSTVCMDFSIALARATGAQVVGSHVYAAKMHGLRFEQLEPTLSAEYRSEAKLEEQRCIHGRLIERGLRLISDSYLDAVAERCAQNKVPFARKVFDGQNYRELVRDVRASNYDLVVMGAHGQGTVKESLIGSVAERVIRRIQVDALVVKDTRPWEEQDRVDKRPIVVALDGSPHSFYGLGIGAFLAKQFNKRLQGIAVYDPFLHHSIFRSLAEVLSDEASRFFKFKEQEKLHGEVIDAGLAKIYRSHLEVGERLAAAEGVEMETVLLPGKPFEKILHHVRQQNAWMLICGRLGAHSEPDMDLGSNAENLLRLAPCHVLLASNRSAPSPDSRAEEPRT